jgi:hypothetical protein
MGAVEHLGKRSVDTVRATVGGTMHVLRCCPGRGGDHVAWRRGAAGRLADSATVCTDWGCSTTLPSKQMLCSLMECGDHGVNDLVLEHGRDLSAATQSNQHSSEVGKSAVGERSAISTLHNTHLSVQHVLKLKFN